MPKPCAIACAKTFLFTYNFIFMIIGSVALGAGMWLHFDRSVILVLKVAHVTPSGDLLTTVAYLLIGSGAAITVLSFLGCCGACCESVCMLVMYTCLLFIILMSEIIVGVLFVSFKNKINSSIETNLVRQIKQEYNRTLNNSHDLTLAWDLMHVRLKCCAARGPQDFTGQSLYFNRSQRFGYFVPPTCCVMTNDDAQYPQIYNEMDCQTDAVNYPSRISSSEAVKTKGCYTAFKEWVTKHKIIFIITGSLIVIFQIFGLILSCCLLSRIRREQSKYPWYDDEDD